MFPRYDQGMNTHTDTNVKIIENATRDDVRPGDHITWMCVEEIDSVTTKHHREGIAHHRDRDGDWRAKDEACITIGEGTTLTIRRTAPELPTEDEAVIERADGHKYITAIFDGETYRAREAVLGRDGRWYGVWRRATPAPHVDTSVAPEHITPGTWQVDGQ